MVQRLLMLRKPKYNNLIAASSLGKLPRCLVSLRKL